MPAPGGDDIDWDRVRREGEIFREVYNAYSSGNELKNPYLQGSSDFFVYRRFAETFQREFPDPTQMPTAKEIETKAVFGLL